MTADDTPTLAGWRLTCLALGLASALLVAFATTHGVGVSPNSVSYLTAARNLAAGDGLKTLNPDGSVVPLTMWAPLLPMVLALLAKFGIDPLDSARWLGALLSACNVFLVGLLTWRLGRSALRAVAASWIFLFSLENLEHHTFVLSEPIFLFLSLLGIHFLSKQEDEGGRLPLILSAAAFGLAALTRHAGLSFLGGGLAALWFIGTRDRRRFLRDATIFGVVAGAPVAAWLVRNRLVGHSAVGRPLVLQLDIVPRILKGADTIAGWILPLSIPKWLNLVAALVVTAAAAAVWIYGDRWSGAAPRSVPIRIRRILQCLIVAYIALLGAVTLMDAWIPMSRRVLTPLFTLLLVLGLGSLPRRERWTFGGRAVRAALLLVLALGCAFYAVRGLRWIREAHAEGLGYESVAWKHSGLMERIRTLPEETPIYTNAVEAVYHLTGRISTRVPARINRFSRIPNAEYDQEMAALEESLRDHHAVIVFLNGLEDRIYLPDRDELTRALTLHSEGEWPEGALLRGL
ncbi:MAG TPA: phospholipid carrier-dependent glycosyltransferase [Candidatus Saccharimonadales bacterium]|nr:phospholipid carrier-dependent glycosyltransferase [Candidatus Saccharimonadales bacterium]